MPSFARHAAVATLAVALAGPVLLAGCGSSDPATTNDRPATTDSAKSQAGSQGRSPSDPRPTGPLPKCPSAGEQVAAYRAGASAYAALKAKSPANCRWRY